MTTDPTPDTVELYVPAKERRAIARRLLGAARTLGTDVREVTSTTDGYIVPLSVAAAAELVELAEFVEGTLDTGLPPDDEQPGPDPAHDAGQADPVEAGDETETKPAPRGARKGGK